MTNEQILTEIKAGYTNPKLNSEKIDVYANIEMQALKEVGELNSLTPAEVWGIVKRFDNDPNTPDFEPDNIVDPEVKVFWQWVSKIDL